MTDEIARIRERVAEIRTSLAVVKTDSDHIAQTVADLRQTMQDVRSDIATLRQHYDKQAGATRVIIFAVSTVVSGIIAILVGVISRLLLP